MFALRYKQKKKKHLSFLFGLFLIRLLSVVVCSEMWMKRCLTDYPTCMFAFEIEQKIIVDYTKITTTVVQWSENAAWSPMCVQCLLLSVHVDFDYRIASPTEKVAANRKRSKIISCIIDLCLISNEFSVLQCTTYEGRSWMHSIAAIIIIIIIEWENVHESWMLGYIYMILECNSIYLFVNWMCCYVYSVYLPFRRNFYWKDIFWTTIAPKNWMNESILFVELLLNILNEKQLLKAVKRISFQVNVLKLQQPNAIQRTENEKDNRRNSFSRNSYTFTFIENDKWTAHF